MMPFYILKKKAGPSNRFSLPEMIPLVPVTTLKDLVSDHRIKNKLRPFLDFFNCKPSQRVYVLLHIKED